MKFESLSCCFVIMHTCGATACNIFHAAQRNFTDARLLWLSVPLLIFPKNAKVEFLGTKL